MDQREIAGVARFAGFQGNDLRDAVAVALSESGGDPNYSDQKAGRFGLFALPYNAVTEIDYRDPTSNAMVAHSVYMEAGGFHPWPSFQDGRYVKWLLQATQAVGKIVTQVASEREWIGFRPAEMLREARERQ